MKQYGNFQKDRLEKIFLLAVWTILLSVALVSCNKDEVNDVTDNNSWVQLSVAIPTISVPVNVATRSIYYLSSRVKFRVIAFKQDDISTSGYISYGDFTVGDGNVVNTFRVPYDATYTFVCYSLGSKTLPDFNKEALDITADPASDNLLYCKFNQQITQGKSLLSIKLDYMFSQVLLSASSSYLNADITAIDPAKITPNYKGKLSLANGTLSTVGSSSPVVLSWANFTAAKVVNTGISYIYSGENKVTISLPSVTIGGKTVKNLSSQTDVVMRGNVYYICHLYFNKAPMYPDGLTISPTVKDWKDVSSDLSGDDFNSF